jgi:hypothetical protein
VYSYVRKIKQEAGYDVVIAGGGPAGVAAAVAAGRTGARTLILEATGCLGGMGTSGLVTAFDPMANGEEQLVGGIMKEIVETMYDRGFLKPGIDPASWRQKYHVWTQFQPEGLKLILDEMVVDAGVETRYFTRLTDCDASPQSGMVNGVIVDNVEGLTFIEGTAYIDATGDACLSKAAGVICREAGRDTPNIMPATLTSHFAGIDFDRFSKGDQREKLHEALEAGHFTQYDRHLPGMSQVDHTVGYLNGGHVFGLDALSVKSLSEGMILGRKIVQEYLSFYREYMPGCENAQLVQTGALMGVRESRRILGNYELTLEDYLERRQFPDQIAVFNKFVDVHPYDTSDEEWERFMQEKDETMRLKEGECYGVPYGIVVPKGWKNLWNPGRSASTDVKVQGSLRVMPAASMMGHAAGLAATIAIESGADAGTIDVSELVKRLRAGGANLPQQQLVTEMTRNR